MKVTKLQKTALIIVPVTLVVFASTARAACHPSCRMNAATADEQTAARM